MNKIYFTITGTKYRYGHDFMKPGMKVKLVKEPDNQYDREAIRVEMKNGLGLVGYVANYPISTQSRESALVPAACMTGSERRQREPSSWFCRMR